MIKTVICFAYVVVSMLILTPVGILLVISDLIGLHKPMSVIMRGIGVGWGRLLIAMVGCKVTVSGRENIPRKGGLCFVSNHGSFFDIVLLLTYSGRLLGFVAKKELMLIPFLNMWVSVLGGLFIDRQNLRKALKTINTGVARLRSGRSMIIFPEGHRSRGQGLLPFRPGSLKLATQSGAVIVPVAIAGTYEVFEKNYRAKAVPVEITFCDPIITADIPVADRKQILSDQIFEIIKNKLEK